MGVVGYCGRDSCGMRAAIKDRARALYGPLPGAASLGGGFSFGGN